MIPAPKLVVLGMMSKMPVAGVVWQTVHYLVGFKRLGYDVYYVEAHARTPSMLMDGEDDDSSAKAAAFIANLLSRFDLGDRWAFHALHGDGRCFGLSRTELNALYRDAALLVNLHGGTEPLDEHSATGRLVYLETDPVQLQVELHEELATTIAFLEPHCAFFTFAENLGAPDCGLPVSDRYRFKPTRQPVVLDFWGDSSRPARDVFTTIGNWRQSWRSVSLGAETYHWSKHHEFEKFLDTPSRAGYRFELSLSSIEPGEQQVLEDHGWIVKRALDFSTDVDAYREYVARSRGEFTVAKDQNVRLRTGWFSDRSATYLAAGRPVVTQDTGFGNTLPVGRGLFAFSNGDQIVNAVAEINADYRLQRRAAREIAAEFFDATSVLGRLLEEVGLSSSPPASNGARTEPSHPAPAGRSHTSLVIPCFNLGEYLRESVESAQAQTLAPDELIVVDDGSSDPATLEVLAELESDGVTVLRTENRGAPAARNYGIERARGELILCLDADDVLLPAFLEQTVAALDENPDAAIAATHVEFFGNTEDIWEPPDFDPTLLLWENCVGSASVFRRQAWREAGGYADLAAFQDWDLWISMIERGWRWVVVPEVLYRYRVRNGSISELGRKLRPELLRAIQERHPDTYRKNSADVRVRMDAEIRRLRSEVRRIDGDVRARDAEVLALKESLRERNQAEVTAMPTRPQSGEAPFGRLESIVAAIDAPEAKLVGASVSGDGSLRLEVLGGWSAEATAQTQATEGELERLRLEGADFLLVPTAARQVLEELPELRRSLECRYYAALRDENDGLIFDLRAELDSPTFSVVICTYRRPQLLRRALASALSQDYPADRYEVLVVDNEPSEQTRAIVAEAQAASRVRLSYFVEERSGLSAARNAAIVRARGEFVAYLDDDAAAATHWLSAFAAVVNQYGALAIGGRVELTMEEGVDEPPWLKDQYARGFFGLNYRNWGKTERVFRIRRPLYLGGGNSAYAKRLFRSFGGFRAELGRTGGKMMAAEETLLNALIERCDVPLYYNDEAVVSHLISADRLTKREIRRKAYWSGVSNAIVERLLGGERTGPMRRQHGSGDGFELAHDLGLALQRRRLSLSARLGAEIPDMGEPPGWTAEHWLSELTEWPEGRAKHEELANAHAVLGNEAEADQALQRVAAYGYGSTTGNVIHTLGSRRLLRAQYELLVHEIHRVLESTVPPESRVLIASRGDDRLAALRGRQGWHFPQDSQGVYAGYYPADSDDAISQLASLREKGAEFLVFPVTSLWWLEHYRGLAAYLDEHGQLLREGEPCTIYALREPDLQEQVSTSAHQQPRAVSL